MKKGTLLFLTLFRLFLCSFVPQGTLESGVVNLEVPLIETNHTDCDCDCYSIITMELWSKIIDFVEPVRSFSTFLLQRTDESGANSSPLIGKDANQDYGSMLPMELWCYIMDFLDVDSGDEISLSCKAFYEASKASNTLHLKKVQKWMVNGLNSRKRVAQTQSFTFDIKTAYFEIDSSFIRNFYWELDLLNKFTILTVMQGMKRLKLSCDFLDSVVFQEGRAMQFSKIKELRLAVHTRFSYQDVVDFQQIQLYFPNIELLQLDLYLGQFKQIPLTAMDRIFAMPMLKKLEIRIIIQSKEPISYNLLSFLELLKDERVEVKFDTGSIVLDEAIASKIYDMECKNQEKRLKMNERVFFSVDYHDLIRKKITDNTMQIHSLVYSANGYDSLDEIFSQLGAFEQLEKLVFKFPDAITCAHSELTKSGLKPFANLVDLELNCFTTQCLSLLQSLHLVFPNLTRLHIRIPSDIHFDSLPESLFQLRELERLWLFHLNAKSKALLSLLNAVKEGKFPRLSILEMPTLVNENEPEIPGARIYAVYYHLTDSDPLLKILNMPQYFP